MEAVWAFVLAAAGFVIGAYFTVRDLKRGYAVWWSWGKTTRYVNRKESPLRYWFCFLVIHLPLTLLCGVVLFNRIFS